MLGHFDDVMRELRVFELPAFRPITLCRHFASVVPRRPRRRRRRRRRRRPDESCFKIFSVTA